MYRTLLKDIIQWKEKNKRMPLLLDGARQVGKSYLLEKLFGEVYFSQVIILDFLAEPDLKSLFINSKNPITILKNIQITFDVDFDAENGLLIFDEIGECQEALDSLKYFHESRPDIYICASGSNIGLLGSFPVGQVESLHLYPMTFEEFLIAHDTTHLIKAFQNCERNEIIHKKLWAVLLDYNFVGGMPKAVHTWVTGDHSKISSLIRSVRQIQKDLIQGYINDFGKYTSNKSVALNIAALFNKIPTLLPNEIDGSVKRFRFSHIIPGKSSYRDLATPIEYLVKTHLISKNYIIEGKHSAPLLARMNESRFKLFLLDVGLLHCMLEISYKEILSQNFDFKGYVAENYSQNEIIALGLQHTYSWKSKNDAEIEFIFKDAGGNIIPVEVKSGKRTKAKSLGLYIETYNPVSAYKFTANIGGFRNLVLKTLPLYYLKYCIKELISEEC